MTDPDNLGNIITVRISNLYRNSRNGWLSRVLGGYHIQADNVAGLELGRDVAKEVWKFYKTHIGEALY